MYEKCQTDQEEDTPTEMCAIAIEMRKVGWPCPTTPLQKLTTVRKPEEGAQTGSEVPASLGWAVSCKRIVVKVSLVSNLGRDVGSLPAPPLGAPGSQARMRMHCCDIEILPQAPYSRCELPDEKI